MAARFINSGIDLAMDCTDLRPPGQEQPNHMHDGCTRCSGLFRCPVANEQLQPAMFVDLM